jgi:amino acid transporter
MLGTIRRLLIGPPLPTHWITFERLGVLSGLAVFAADALSSVAYGTEEILRMLIMAGVAGLAYTVPVAIAIAALLAAVAASYRQTVVEYPSGGGAYVVARDNLGRTPSLVAGGALLNDYVLTVAVSVAAGVAAITSAWPVLYEHRVAIGLLCVIFMALVNLRGVRESAMVFGVPVYGFVLVMLALLAVGLGRGLWGSLRPVSPAPSIPTAETLSLFLILRAFSSGCAALTGVEAVANGVQAFRPPSGQNAARVLALLGLLLGTMFLGTTLLAHHLAVTPMPQETALSQIGKQVFGRGTWYYLLQGATALILILAANTSFADFPRLSAFMALDGYMPRQFSNLGDRLVYSNGIMTLAALSCVLIAAFKGDVHLLIPLYALGVFTAFTLSQSGMVLHWVRKGGVGWRRKAVVNALGALTTGMVLTVVAATKFVHGAWIVCIVIPLMILALQAIRRHYDHVAARLTLKQAWSVKPLRNLNLLLVGGMHRGTLKALQYAKALAGPIRAVHVETGGESTPRVQQLWRRWERDIPLVVLPSPYRNLSGPLVDYIDKVRRQEGYDIVTVVLPEFVVDSPWESMLHNHSALWLQIVLRNVPGVAVLNMRYKL